MALRRTPSPTLSLLSGKANALDLDVTPILPLPSPLSEPPRLRGWMWRREGIFRRFKRRFCVFHSTTLFIFAGADTVNGRLLRRLVATQIVLTRASEFRIVGYLPQNELHKRESDVMASQSASRWLPGSSQRFYAMHKEVLRAECNDDMWNWASGLQQHMQYRLRDSWESTDDDLEDDLDILGAEQEHNELETAPFVFHIEREAERTPRKKRRVVKRALSPSSIRTSGNTSFGSLQLLQQRPSVR